MRRLVLVLAAATLGVVACTPVDATPTPAGPREAWIPVSAQGGALIDSSRYPAGATIEVREDWRFSESESSGGVCLSVTTRAQSANRSRYEPVPGSKACTSDNKVVIDGEVVGDFTDKFAFLELGEPVLPNSNLEQGYSPASTQASNPVPLLPGVNYYGASFGTATENGRAELGGGVVSKRGCLSRGAGSADPPVEPGDSGGLYPGDCLPDVFVIRW